MSVKTPEIKSDSTFISDEVSVSERNGTLSQKREGTETHTIDYQSNSDNEHNVCCDHHASTDIAHTNYSLKDAHYYLKMYRNGFSRHLVDNFNNWKVALVFLTHEDTVPNIDFTMECMRRCVYTCNFDTMFVWSRHPFFVKNPESLSNLYKDIKDDAITFFVQDKKNDFLDIDIEIPTQIIASKQYYGNMLEQEYVELLEKVLIGNINLFEKYHLTHTNTEFEELLKKYDFLLFRVSVWACSINYNNFNSHAVKPPKTNYSSQKDPESPFEFENDLNAIDKYYEDKIKSLEYERLHVKKFYNKVKNITFMTKYFHDIFPEDLISFAYTYAYHMCGHYGDFYEMDIRRILCEYVNIKSVKYIRFYRYLGEYL